MKYELTEYLKTGNTIIDNEHRELLNMANKLLDACNNGRESAAMESAVKFLVDYVDKHFKHEEQLQQKSRYPGYPAHKTFHDSYKRNLNNIVSQLLGNNFSMANFAKFNSHIGVLINHISTEDKKLGMFLNSNT